MQKTAYEMRISDWSSDVCSSDLIAADLRYSTNFRLALRVHYLFGFQEWLRRELSKRFTNLMCKRSVAQQLIRFAQKELQPLLGAEATGIIIEADRKSTRLNSSH